MALLDDTRKKVVPKPIAGQGRNAGPYTGKSDINPDWVGGLQAGSATESNHIERYKQNKIGNDPAYQAFRQNLLGPLGLGNNEPQTEAPTEEETYFKAEQEQAEAMQAIRNPQVSSRAQTKNESSKERRQLPRINLLGSDVKARATATRVTTMNASWIGYLWFFVQLPLAIISIMCLGFVAAIDSILNSNNSSEDTSIIGWMATQAASIVSTVFDWIAEFIGIDFAGIAFYIAMGCYALILSLGIISIFAVYIQYITGGLRPTTGKAGGLKTGMLLLAIIGYSTPMLNMFPFIFLWMAAVWYHPK